jgi:hypothetical protein
MHSFVQVPFGKVHEGVPILEVKASSADGQAPLCSPPEITKDHEHLEGTPAAHRLTRRG